MTPALDALLKEVEALGATLRGPRATIHVATYAGTLAPRLAAMLRVAVEALDANLDSSNVVPSKSPGWRLVSAEVLSMARAALARIEALAKGGA